MTRSEAEALAKYGWTPFFEEQRNLYTGKALRVARVAVEYPSEYLLYTADGECRGVLAGRLRGRAKRGHATRPSVGDWVMFADEQGEGRVAVIHHVLARRTQLVRKAAGRAKREQVIGANVDVVFVTVALDTDLNFSRLERYLALVYDSGAELAIVLTKADCCKDPASARAAVQKRHPGVPVHVISAHDDLGLGELEPYLQGRKTVAMIGVSGAGKSTLINRWLGGERQAVSEVGTDGRGRHTTTNRFLLVCDRPGGGLVMDTPGMRELGLVSAHDGTDETFADIDALAEGCRFRDCRHHVEPGCAVLKAVRDGELPSRKLENFRKLRDERTN